MRVDATGLTIYFECSHASCRFYGDGIELTAAARGIPISTALGLFRPGNALAHCLSSALLEAEAASYTDGRATQGRVRVYLQQCRNAARQTPEKLNLRSGLSPSKLKLVPPEVGLLVRDVDMPVGFREFSKSKYRHSSFVLYPYTYDDDITHVKAYDGKSVLPPQDITITRNDVGVYMERFDDVPKKLIAVSSPRVASVLYGTFATLSARRAPVMSVAGYPLPSRFRKVHELLLLSTTDAPFTLGDALQVLSAGEIVSCSETPPLVSVAQLQQDSDEIQAEELFQLLKTEEHTPLHIWVARTIQEMEAAGKIDEVQRCIVASAGARALDTLRKSPTYEAHSPAVKALLQPREETALSMMTLGNGKPIRRGGSSLIALNADGEESVLANVGISVTCKISVTGGDELLVCTIAPPDTNIPPVQVRFPESSWGRPESLQKLVTKAFAARGFAPYVAFYSRPRCDWRDILCKLAEQCEVRQEVGELGIDEALDIHFPTFVACSTAKQVAPQQQLVTVPPHVLQMYSGFPPYAASGACSVYSCFLSEVKDEGKAAFIAGLMHVVHQATNELRSILPGMGRRPKHLFYVGQEWVPIFREVAEFFSHSDYIQAFHFTKPTETLHAYEKLGTLPLISHVPLMGGGKLQRLINDSPLSLLSSVDNVVARGVNGDLRTAFILPPDTTPKAPSAEDIAELREAFPAFLTEYIRRVPITFDYKTDDLSYAAAYDASCRMLEIGTQPLVRSIARTAYHGSESLDTFFAVLYSLEQKEYTRTVPPRLLIITDEYVAICKKLVRLLNLENPAVYFSTEEIEKGLAGRGMLVNVPQVSSKAYWVIDRRTWNACGPKDQQWATDTEAVPAPERLGSDI